jgi:hypothetical protein
MKYITNKFIDKLNNIGSKIKEDPKGYLLEVDKLEPANYVRFPDKNLNEVFRKIHGSAEKEDFFNFSDLFSGAVDKDDKSFSSHDIQKSKKFPPENEDDLFKEIDFGQNTIDNENNIKDYNIHDNNPSFPDLKKIKDPKIDSTKIDPIELDPSNINLPKIKSVDEDLADLNKKKESNAKDFFKNGTCNFYNKCPDDYMELGNFSLEGTSLKCGNIENTSPAKAMAHIKNNNLYEIVILDKGKGYSVSNPPKINIHSRNEEKGFGANANAIIDEDGSIKSIQIINPGYNYTETPNILIDPPYMNNSCHLCCNF